MSDNYTVFYGPSGDAQTVAWVDGGAIYSADHTHTEFDNILDAVAEGDNAYATELRDASFGVVEAFDAVEVGRVAIAGHTITFDGEPIDSALATTILRFRKQGLAFHPLLAFLGNLMENPSEHSRDQLFDWLRDRNLTITDDGHFIAYKGLDSDGRSLHSGPALVDGAPMHGRIPNRDGSVISMARGQVQADSHIGCSVGLHAGTWEYANSFGYITKVVKINPRDVVSVPTDCQAQKLRVCRYEVLGRRSGPSADVLWAD